MKIFHQDLAKKHRHVDIYIYIADHPKEEMTIDKYKRKLILKK